MQVVPDFNFHLNSTGDLPIAFSSISDYRVKIFIHTVNESKVFLCHSILINDHAAFESFYLQYSLFDLISMNGK